MLIDLESTDVATALLVTLAFIVLLAGNAASLVTLLAVLSVETWVTVVTKFNGKLVLDTAT